MSGGNIEQYIECDNLEKLWDADRIAFYNNKSRMENLSFASGLSLDEIKNCK